MGLAVLIVCIVTSSFFVLAEPAIEKYNTQTLETTYMCGMKEKEKTRQVGALLSCANSRWSVRTLARPI